MHSDSYTTETIAWMLLSHSKRLFGWELSLFSDGFAEISLQFESHDGFYCDVNIKGNE
jgi:hypothetical protein